MSYRSKQMLIVRRDLKMRKGKIAAQASHASVEAVLKAIVKENRMAQLRVSEEGYAYLDAPEGEDSPLTDWFRYGMAKICVYVDSEEALRALDAKAREMGIVTALIRLEMKASSKRTWSLPLPVQPWQMASAPSALAISTSRA